MSKTVVVTGASSGIGRAIALAWARRGARVVLSARNEGALATVAGEVRDAGGEAYVQAGDVTVEDDRARLVRRATQETGRLDVLVNNAGRGYYGSILSVDARELEALFALNVIAPLRLTQLAAEPLVRSGGTIVMMSSVVGVVAGPRYGAYAASKFALEALAVALRAELASTGVRVLVVRPGPVDTPFRANSVSTDGRAGVRPPGAKVQAPEEVARLTMEAFDAGRAVVETTPFVKIASMASRVAPPVMRAVARVMASRAGH